MSVLQTAGRLAQPQVARVAGVPQGHLTYYFPRRFDLMAAVAGRFVEMLREDFPPLLDVGGWDRMNEALRARAMRFVARLAKDRARTRMLLGLLVAAEEDAALREVMADNVGMLRKVIAGMLGKEEGEPDVDIVLATFWGIGLQHLVLEGRRTDAETDAILDRMRDWFAVAPAQPKAPRAARPRAKAKDPPCTPKRSKR